VDKAHILWPECRLIGRRVGHRVIIDPTPALFVTASAMIYVASIAIPAPGSLGRLVWAIDHC